MPNDGRGVDSTNELKKGRGGTYAYVPALTSSISFSMIGSSSVRSNLQSYPFPVLTLNEGPVYDLGGILDLERAYK